MITDEAVAEFISLTSASTDEARGYLEMAGGELQAAVNLFLEMGGPVGLASPAMGAVPAPPRPNGAGQAHQPVVDADVAAEVAAAAAAAGIDPASMTGLPDAHMADVDAEGVRAPMPAYEDQIINPDYERRRMEEAMSADSAAMNRRMSFDRPPDLAGAGAGDEGTVADGEGQVINQLFAPPSYNEADAYYAVIEKAKSEGKWVLVNIQQAEVFASHTLNRDVWSDDTIRDVVQGSFLFWQRDDKSTEGDQFCQYYQCGHQLPHICIIDPRTGRRVKAWDGRKWIESHAAAEYLFGFLDEFSMSRSPPAMSPAGSPALQPQAEPVAGGSGDLQLTGFDATMETADEALEPAAPQEPVAAMPEEPADSAEHLKVSFRLPSGQRVTRRFLPTDPLEQMFAVASALTEQPPSRVDLSTQFPKRSLRDVPGGLQVLMKDAEVAGNMVLVNVRSA
mmetsp:Transcript_127435/g.354756  ORF Transcript_127435/g.354756 Transcript_127435/m.354756 type:complete len:450 (-) Transcript_127435:204-1553(-)